ncbi:MAG: efflux RND transporter permease subunit, partial [Puniceicoccaceae bacterium]
MRDILGNILRFLAGRRLAVGVVAGLIVLLAVMALFRMPLQLLPEVRYPQVRVIGDLPGQTSAVIEESVNEPLEPALAGTPGLVRMESRSGDGRSYIDLFFEPGHDMDRALREVEQGVQRARDRIPAGFPEPRIFEVATSDEPALHFAFGSDRLTPAELRQRLRSSLLPRLRAIDGVDMVFMGREEDPELVVDLNPSRQRSLGISLEEVEMTLMEATAPPSGGTLLTGDFEGVGVLGESVWEEERLLARTFSAGGDPRATVPLSSFAQAYRAPSETSLRTRLDGSSAVLVTVYRSPQARSLRMAREVRRTVDTVMERRGFENVQATLLFDDSVVTSGAVRSVMVAAGFGSLLAMGLVFFTLRQGRRVVLVGVVVLVGLACAVLALAGAGMSLNLLTLAGLLISVGLGLDYAIIFFDRLNRRSSGSDDEPVEAMLDVATPLFGALLTTVAAVLPFLLVEGLVALLFRPLILTVIFSSLFAYLVALVMLPVFTRPEGGERKEARPAPLRPWPGAFWRTARSAWVTGPVFALLLVGGVILVRVPPFEVLPVVDDGFVDVRIVHPAGISPEAMDRVTRRVEAAVMKVDGTAGLFTTVGGYFREGLPSFRPGTANFMVRVDTLSGRRPSAEWARDARAAIDELQVMGLSVRVQLPRIRGVRTRLSDADIEVILTRPDGNLLALSEIEAEVEEALRGVAGLADVERMRGGVSPRWRIEPDYAALSHYGVSLGELRRTVEYAMEGKVLAQRMERGDPLSLRVRYSRDYAGGPQHMESLVIPSLGGGWIHLAEVSRFDLVEEPTHIERRENQRVVRLGAQLDPGGPGPARVAAEVESTLASLDFPDEISWWLEGEVEALEETRRTFGLALSLALLMVLLILAVQYGSFIWAL